MIIGEVCMLTNDVRKLADFIRNYDPDNNVIYFRQLQEE